MTSNGVNKILLIGLLVFLPQFAFAGSQTYSTPGTYTFAVPSYGSLTVTVNGAGGGGGGGGPIQPSNPGSLGETSSVGSVLATGGTGGRPCATPRTSALPPGSGAPGSDGSGSGGDTNYTGGGAAGGGGGSCIAFGYVGGTGGAGGRALKTYATGVFTPGSGMTITVGEGGAGGSGHYPGTSGGNIYPGAAGQNGSVVITWTDPPPPLQCDGTAETYSTPGTYTRTVPTYSSMSVTVNGAGGGGGGSLTGYYYGGTGGIGGGSVFDSISATGGTGGTGCMQRGFISGQAGTDGTGSGGDANYSGTGGTGGTGAYCLSAYAGRGGAGGKSVKTYGAGALATGGTVSVTVGTGGAAGTAGTAYTPASPGQNGSVTITCSQNSPPTTPVITGPTSGLTKTNYTYTFRSTDPDSDTIRYAIDWNDNGTVDEYVPALGYVSSGTTGSTSHSWNSSNTQTFKALAQDSLGNTSGWASYTVNMSPNAPTVLLTATPSSITNGQSSTLTWSSTNANSCTGTNFSTGGATSGTASVSPTVTTTYTVTCTGAGGTASDSEVVTYTCTATNICSGNNVVNSCTGAIVQTCSYQCGGGACIPPPAPVPNPTGTGPTALSGHLQVRPSLVVMGDRTRVFWNFSNVTSCTASRDNPPPESWTVAGTLANGWTSSSGSEGFESGPIVERTTFRLVCTPFAGQTFEPETAVVNVVPIFQEQ